MNKKILLIFEFSLVLFFLFYFINKSFSEIKAQEFQALVSCNNSECVTSVAIQNKDILVCNQINTLNIPQNLRENDFLKDECIARVAIAINNFTVCDSLNTKRWKNFCNEKIGSNLMERAFQTKNSSLCMGVYRESCYQYMGFDFKNYLNNFDFFLYWSKVFLYWIGSLLIIALVLYSYYRQIKNRISFQSHISKLTIIGLIATALLGFSLFFDIMFSSGGHAIPLTFFTGIPLMLFIILGALMIFKKSKLINN